MVKPLYFTICSANYLAYALTLGRSLTAADPDARFVIFLADEGLSAEDRARIGFEVVEARELPIPTFADMALRYSIMEFNTAIKAAALQYAFDTLGAEAAVYLDPDILVLKPLADVEAALRDGAELVLTPHATSPLDDGGDPDDVRLMRTGVYNLGFCAFRDTPDARRFIAWWAERMAVDCRVALEEGLFVDQKFLDLGPAYVPGAHILRHPGYNTAYWNLSHRPVTREGGEWLAAGRPLHFFHFSGVVPGDPSVFSKHQDRFQVSDIGELSDLLADYLARLAANGHDDWRTRPYAYASGPDGEPLHDIARAVWRRAHPEPVKDAGGAAADLIRLCNEPSPQVASDPARPVTRFAYEVWAGRTDLRRAFDIDSASGRAAFLDWLVSTGVREHRIPAVFLAPVHGGARPAPSPLWGALARHRHHLRPVARLLPPQIVAAARRRAGYAEAAPGPAPDAPAAPPPELADPEREPGSVAVFGYFSTESGVGEGARRAVRALRAVGRPVTARAVTTHGIFEDRLGFELPLQTGPSRAEAHLFHINADEMMHAPARMPEMIAPGRLRIGYWAWELDVFPDAWRAAAEHLDEIWTPSRFVRDAVAAKVAAPVHIVPHPTPVAPPVSEETRLHARRCFALPEDRVLALCLFDFNSFAARKNPEGALAAFERAGAGPGTALIVKCHGGARHDARRFELLRRLRGRGDIFVIDRVLNAEEMAALYDAADMLVSLHRSEGFGLTLAEAMARGLPVIATDHSGSTDILDETCGLPVPCELVPVPPGAYPYGEGARWAEPDIGAAAEMIARLASDPGLRERLGEAGRRRIAERFSLEQAGRMMDARLSALSADAARRAAG